MKIYYIKCECLEHCLHHLLPAVHVVDKLRERAWCASGCVVECRICNREVAGLNLSLGYFAPRSTQHSIHARSVYEYHLRLGRQRQVLLIPIADERVQVKL